MIRIIVIFVAIGLLGHAIQANALSFIWSAGTTPMQSADTLVNDPEFGNRALLQAENYGDKILEPLRKASLNFSKIGNRNAPWIATVLAHDKSPAALALSTELFGRNEEYAKLIGAVGLAAQGKYPEEINDSAYIVRVAMKRPPPDSRYPSMDPLYEYTPLAVMALSETRNPKAFSYLARLLQDRNVTGWVKDTICAGFGVLGDKDAIAILRQSLATVGDRGKCRGFIAFDALLSLGYAEAIPLAIERIKSDGTTKGDFVLREMERVTGRQYDRDYLKWSQWWDKEKTTWQVPNDVYLGYTALNY